MPLLTLSTEGDAPSTDADKFMKILLTILGPLQAVAFIVYYFKMKKLLSRQVFYPLQQKLDNYLITTLSLLALSIACVVVISILDISRYNFKPT
jgi:hypothetical protein